MAAGLKGLWPEIVDADSAQKAAKNGWQAAFVVAAMTGIVAGIAIATGPIAGIDGWSLIDAGFAAVIGWRIMRMSRAWAVVGLLYWIYNLIGRVTSGQATSAVGIVTILILLGFISGVRGTFAFHRYKRESAVPVAVV